MVGAQFKSWQRRRKENAEAYKKRMERWAALGFPVDHLFESADVCRIGRDYFDRKAVEKRMKQMVLIFQMGALDPCHKFLLEILCPTEEDFIYFH